MADTDALWGGQLTDIHFDPVRRSCDLDVTTLLNGRTTKYAITASGLTDFRFRNAISEPWEYAEVTEAHLDVDGSGHHVLQVLLWSEDAEIVLRCSELVIREVSP